MTQTPNGEQVEETNKVLVQRWFDELWNQGNEAVAEEIVTPDCTFHDPASRGDIPATHEAHYAAYRSAFPDLAFAIEDLIAEDDEVAARFTATGTHEGEFWDHAPTGNEFEIDGVVFNRIEDGRIAETRPVWDVFGLMGQLGLGETS